MVILLSTLPAQVLEPLCGLPIPSAGARRPVVGADRAVVVAIVVRGMVGRVPRRVAATRCRAADSARPRLPAYPAPRPTTTPRASLRAAAGQGLGPADRLRRLPVRRGRGATTSTSSSAQRPNTRDDVLRRDLTDLVVRPGTCYAQSGVLHDPYTGQSIGVVRGPDDLRGRARPTIGSRCRDAWYKGAARMGRAAPSRFRQRSAQPAGRRRTRQLRQGISGRHRVSPPNAAFRCEFVAPPWNPVSTDEMDRVCS